MKLSELTKQPAIVIAILAVVVIFFLVVGSLRPPELPKKTSYWSQPPDIFICDVATVDEGQVIEAVEYWQELGFEFGVIIDDYNCTYNDDEDYRNIYLPNTIFIYPEYKKLKEDKAGVAIRSIDEETQETYSTVIEIRTFKDRVIRHELGHALGWEHTNQLGHIMYPKLSGSGLDAEGLSPDTELSPLEL
jgi:hypothetical protein